MKRRAFLAAMACARRPQPVIAQQTERVWRIGYLGSGATAPGPGAAALQIGLRQLGYVEGKSHVMEYRWSGTNVDRLPGLAAELVASRVDLIVAPGNQAVLAAKAATTTIPIVAIGVINPVETGLVKSLAQPGGNITGVTWEIGTDPVGKKFETFKEMVPRASRMAVVWNPTLSGAEQYRVPRLTAARSLGLRLAFFEYATADKFDAALNAR